MRRERQKAGLPFFSTINGMETTKSNTFVIEITTGWISQENRRALMEVLQCHQGTTELMLYVTSPETGFRILFKSRRFGVTVSEALAADLDRIGVRLFPKGLIPSLA